jgi:uncharacterized protein YkuJ
MYGEFDCFDDSFDQFEHDGSVMFDIESYQDEDTFEFNHEEEIPF